MKHFTSLTRLYASDALRNRVVQVEETLKKINPEWQHDWLFPIAFVFSSNGEADYYWVKNRKSVQEDSPHDAWLEGQFPSRMGPLDALEAINKALTDLSIEWAKGGLNAPLPADYKWPEVNAHVVVKTDEVQPASLMGLVGGNEIVAATVEPTVSREAMIEALRKASPVDLFAVLSALNEDYKVDAKATEYPDQYEVTLIIFKPKA